MLVVSLLPGKAGVRMVFKKPISCIPFARGELDAAAKLPLLLIGELLAVGCPSAQREGPVAHRHLGTPGLGVVQKAQLLAAELVVDTDVSCHQEGGDEEGKVALVRLRQTARADAARLLAGDHGLGMGEQGGGEPLPLNLHTGHLKGDGQVFHAGALVQLFTPLSPAAPREKAGYFEIQVILLLTPRV